VLWPADDVWPGQEFDLGEILEDGRPYLTTHWADENGDDAHNPHFAEVDESQWHTWAVRWEPGKLTYTVDGAVVGVDTDHVPADFAHGGKNDVFGGMNRPGDDTSLTLGEVRWTPLG
jgi:beta-glucanase (GH16 family)